MEKKIKELFELQKFAPNLRISAMISETEKRCNELSDFDLEKISAAGELFVEAEEKKDGNPG